jgi:hypothetical protein
LLWRRPTSARDLGEYVDRRGRQRFERDHRAHVEAGEDLPATLEIAT